MRPPSTVTQTVEEDGAVVLRFHAHQEFRGRQRRHRFVPSYPEDEPYVGILSVWFRREDPNDPASPPVSVEAVSLWEPQGITPTELQRFAWSRWLTVADAVARIGGDMTHPSWKSNLITDPDTVAGKMTRALYEEHGIAAPTGKRPGRKGHPSEFYEQLATRYKELRTKGERSPTRAIAQEMHYSRNTVAGWVKRARALGYLPPGRRGRPG